MLEARDRVGGACTMEEPWPGVRMSPCAYVAGLLHPTVIRELDLPGRGFRWFPAVGGLFVPFEDGSSIQLWNDDARCEAEITRFAPGDLAGWRAMQAAKRRLRDALRPVILPKPVGSGGIASSVWGPIGLGSRGMSSTLRSKGQIVPALYSNSRFRPTIITGSSIFEISPKNRRGIHISSRDLVFCTSISDQVPRCSRNSLWSIPTIGG